MKIVAIGTLKGGTGKTTMTFNLAGVLAEKHKVCLIDVDPQCNLSNNVGVDITEQDVFSSREIFETPGVIPQDLIIKAPIEELPNLDIIPGNIKLVATELHISNRAARERILRNYLEDNTGVFGEYDYILIDTNPSMGIVNQNAFLAADSIILVTDVDDNSRVGLHLFMYLWEEIRKDLRIPDNVDALIVNKGDLTTRITKDIWEYCSEDEDLSPLLVPQMVRAKVAYAKAALARVPINKYVGANKAERVAAKEAADEIRNVVQYLTSKEVF